jgi:hypothetical protein
MFHSIITKEELIGNFLQINFPKNYPNEIHLHHSKKFLLYIVVMIQQTLT